MNKNLHFILPDGRYDYENNETGIFVWTKKTFTVEVPQCGIYEFYFSNNTFENIINYINSNGTKEIIPLIQGWQTAYFYLSTGKNTLYLDNIFHCPNDDRELGIMISSIKLSESLPIVPTSAKNKNFLLNQHEYVAGKEVLESYPPNLRVTISKKCNIGDSEPCVYCSWNKIKTLERSQNFDYYPNFLYEIGKFFYFAQSITDCSYGEPLMSPHFEEFLIQIDSAKIPLEITTNGILLTEKFQKILLGKNVILHISLDTVDNALYTKLRTNKLKKLINNVKSFCTLKKKTNDKPFVIINSIVMQSNKNDLHKFLAFMKKINVDCVRLQALQGEFTDGDKVKKEWKFSIAKETIPYNELKNIKKDCLEFSQNIGLRVICEWDEYADNVSNKLDNNLPLCSEPWKTAYILNRGIMPCCSGREPLVFWEALDKNNLEQSLHAAFNSENFRAIRRELATHRLPQYCLRHKDCPLVKRLLKI